MTVQGFIITLDRAVERRSQVDRLRQICPVPCEPLPAVDGRSLGEAERTAAIGERLFRPRYPFSLRDGEVGVFLSHRKAWKEIVTRNLDAGLILEDDVELDLAVFRPAFELGFSVLRPLDVIKFSVPRRSQVPADYGEAPRIRAPVVTPLGATSLLVGNAAARRLLELTERFDRPVDTFLQMSWVTDIRPRVVTPSGVTEISARLGGTTIHAKQRSWVETLSRNLLRPAYRLQVNAYSYLQGPPRRATERSAVVDMEQKPCS